MIRLLYETGLRAVRGILSLAARRDGKLGRGVRGRRAAVATLEAWAREHRDPARPLVWLHAPSVGEALMAQAIAAALRARHPDAQLAFTFFSPTAERVADRVGADVFAYLPWDVRRDVRRSLAALQPDVVAFIRTEVWPTLVREAKRRGARVALLNAPLASGSSRLRPIARALLSSSYAQLDQVGVVGADDAIRFRQLRVSGDRLRVTGDARFDQVWQRVQRMDRGHALLEALRSGPPLVVAGSTWPEDEARLITAWSRLPPRSGRLVLAPHEPTPAHLAALEAALDGARLRHARIDAALEDDAPSVLIVDRVGVLADLYSAARVAYVGGGFGHDGLHSVIEPAALGVPVLFGPNHGNAVEADELVGAGGGFVVRDEVGLEERLVALLRNPAAGERARAFVQARLGGAERNAALIEELLTQARS